MRILIIHNYYQDPGGEDEVFRLEKLTLSETEEVHELKFVNKKSWEGLLQFFLYPYNFIAKRQIELAIKNFKPDVVHFHNLHYAAGPVAIRVVSALKIPMVMTLHNFRLICPSATLFYKGHVFLESIKANFPWKAIKLGLFSNSRIKTFWLASANWLHRKWGTWNLVDRYIVLTNFALEIYLSSSLNINEKKFSVKPNFIINSDFPEVEKQDYLLYVGRLSEEKGIRILLEAALHGDFKVRIVGDGPLKNEVLAATKQRENIIFLGSLEKEQVLKQMSGCSALIFPSVCYEGMPMSIIEAFACSTPVIASDLGAMQTMIISGENGLLFIPSDVESLSQKISFFEGLSICQKLQMGKNARAVYESRYNDQANKDHLLTIYRSAIASHGIDG